jgi:indolepyruvate ferredoxin oxidoreductase beta subunit
MQNKNFKTVIVGVGGQGVITLLALIAEAAFIEGYDVKSSELRGLSQRGGSVDAHIIFGKKVYSPLVPHGHADLIMGLEMLEGLRGSAYANKDAKFLVNDYILPFLGILKKEEILSELKKIAKNKLYLVPASADCKDKLQNEIVSTIYLLGYAVQNSLIPLKAESVLTAIKNIVPTKYQELNIKAFNLSHD